MYKYLIRSPAIVCALACLLIIMPCIVSHAAEYSRSSSDRYSGNTTNASYEPEGSAPVRGIKAESEYGDYYYLFVSKKPFTVFENDIVTKQGTFIKQQTYTHESQPYTGSNEALKGYHYIEVASGYSGDSFSGFELLEVEEATSLSDVLESTLEAFVLAYEPVSIFRNGLSGIVPDVVKLAEKALPAGLLILGLFMVIKSSTGFFRRMAN